MRPLQHFLCRSAANGNEWQQTAKLQKAKLFVKYA